jgi:hypothetical protein
MIIAMRVMLYANLWARSAAAMRPVALIRYLFGHAQMHSAFIIVFQARFAILVLFVSMNVRLPEIPGAPVLLISKYADIMTATLV